MKVALAYFSGTGNTRMIAELYRDALASRGIEVCETELPTRDEEALPDFSSCDLIGIGYPIHAFNAPLPILEFCKKLLPKRDRSQDGKRVFVFKTSGEPVRMSDVSSLKLKKLLARRGYELFAEYQYVMPYNIIFRHTDAAAYKMLTTAKALVPVDVEEILNGTAHLPKRVPFGGMIAGILRIEQPGARLIGRGFKPTDKCTACGLCVKRCPEQNIKLANGKIKFGKACTICMRCVFDCPHDAIKPGILNGWKVNGKYSFEPPTEPEQKTKHDDYCKKAYDRYYADAERRIAEYRAKTDDHCTAPPNPSDAKASPPLEGEA